MRLALSGGSSTIVRTLITAFGIALGTALLLLAMGVGPAMQTRAEREAQRGQLAGLTRDVIDPARNRDEPGTLIAVAQDQLDGEPLVVVFLAGRGPAPPVPPGLPRLPRLNEVFVSPALGATDGPVDQADIRSRLGNEIAGPRIAPSALVHPNELVAWVGRSPLELTEANSVLVRRFPLPAAKAVTVNDKLPIRLGVAVGIAGVIVPILIFVGAMARLGASQRERRLAVLRLIGATPAETAQIAAVEGGCAGVIGGVLGYGLFLALRQIAADVPIGGARWYPTDFNPGPAGIAILIVLIPLLAGGGALLAMRRLTVSPLRVASRGRSGRQRKSRWMVLAIGAVGLAVAAFFGAVMDPFALIILAGLALIMIVLGLPVVGPWITQRVGKGLSATARNAAFLLAGARLQADSSSAFRSSNGVMLGVFVAIVFYGYASGNLGAIPAAQLPGTADVSIDASAVSPKAVNEVLDPLATTEGVDVAVALRRARVGRLVVTVADCAALRDLDVARPVRCGGYDVFATPGTPRSFARARRFRLQAPAGLEASIETRAIGRLQPMGQDVLGGPVVEPEALPRAFVEALPASTILIETDGSGAAVDRVRDIAVPELPGVRVETIASVEDDLHRPVREVQNGINLAVGVLLFIAAASLAASTSTGLLERRRPFTLLRTAGVPTTSLYATTALEAMIPLIVALGLSVILGLGASAAFVRAVGGSYHPPLLATAVLVACALGAGVAVVLATLPILESATRPQALRTE